MVLEIKYFSDLVKWFDIKFTGKDLEIRGYRCETKSSFLVPEMASFKPKFFPGNSNVNILNYLAWN